VSHYSASITVTSCAIADLWLNGQQQHAVVCRQRVQGLTLRLVEQIAAASQLWSIHRTTQRLHPGWSGCYDTHAAPRSGVCREERDGARMGHAEEVRSVGATGTCTVGTETGKCADTHCDVQIGDSIYCSQCGKQGEVPIDGTCTAVNDDSKAKCKQADGNELAGTEQVCGACKDGYFLHKGGCYKFGGEVGKLICTDPSTPDSSLTAGKCTACAPGYFKNPTTAGAAVPPCIACNDTAGFTDSTNTYKGVLNCEVCSPPATSAGARADSVAVCTKCQGTNYLKSDGTACGEKTSTCASDNTEFAKEDAANGNKCVSCGEQTDGVEGCNTCTYDSGTKKVTCTKCTSNYLKTVDGATTCVTDCGPGFFKNDKGGASTNLKVCSPCAANCLTCADGTAEKCTSCTAGTHFLVVVADGAGKCVSCGDTNAGVPNCAKCTAPTTTGQKPACSECNSGFALSEDKTTCTQDTTPQCTTPDCKACDNPAKDNEVCTACTENKYLTPTSQCVDTCSKLGNYYGAAGNKCKECTVANCAECSTDGSCKTCRTGFYLTANECKACDSSCKSCSGATNADCTECPSGKALKYGNDDTKGTCGEGCVVNTAQASGNCKTCDLMVDGTKYCSVCAMDSEYPQNGVCAPKTTRAATCNDGTIQNGVCNTCSAGYFKMNGGCYETSRYPGKSVCTAVASSGGTCQTAAPGYKVENGNLVTCPEGCSACTSSTACDTCADGYVKIGSAQTCTKCDASCLTCETSASTCKACANGYYKTASGSTCASCESNSGSVKGVRGCASCAAPTGSTGPVLCYLVKGGTAGLISSRTCGHLCMATRVTRIASSLLGVSHGGRAPPRQ
ncbi:Variant-specific surface protein, partial [Giardia duodenalis]